MFATKSRSNPVATFVYGVSIAALSKPVSVPEKYSSQPIEGGLAQGSPSMSRPPETDELPAPRHGEPALIWEPLASFGSAVRLLVPLSGNGSVQQKSSALPQWFDPIEARL